jgi:hypothetical protein
MASIAAETCYREHCQSNTSVLFVGYLHTVHFCIFSPGSDWLRDVYNQLRDMYNQLRDVYNQLRDVYNQLTSPIMSFSFLCQFMVVG